MAEMAYHPGHGHSHGYSYSIILVLFILLAIIGCVCCGGNRGYGYYC